MATKFKREFKNVVLNYTDAETKVREATSNDPWGPSSALMSELADYTYHVQAYGLVMGMLWKRLNDHGKNWRHVYKSLTVLEYLIKAGSERVTQQCKDNIFSIQTLKDFQYVDKDGKDQGANIREKAKNLVALLKDDIRLKEERKRAKQAKERQEGLSNDSPKPQKKVQFDTTDSAGSTSPSAPEASSPGRRFEQNVEQARPADETEEEMQLRLALQISKQQAEEEERLKNQEEESLKAAIALSRQETLPQEEETEPEEPQNDLLLDFSTTGIADPWSSEPVEEPPPSYDVVTSDPWGSSSIPPSSENQVKLTDPWASGGQVASLPPTAGTIPLSSGDPWNTQPSSSLNVGITQPNGSSSMSNPFDLSTLGLNIPPLSTATTGDASPKPNRIEDQFLGDHAPLVDLDSLLSNPIPKPIFGPTPTNPFGVSGGTTQQQNSANPFTANKAPAPSLNQLATTKLPGYGDLLPPPILPTASSTGSAGNSPILPHRQPSPYTQPSSTNQSFNPFS